VGLNSDDHEHTQARLKSELADSEIERLVAYDERMRSGATNGEEDLSLESDSPEMAKAIQALRDVFGNSIDALRSSVAWVNGIPKRFELHDVLGDGSFGIVYKAYDKWLQRMVALKVMRPELMANKKLRQRFLRESRAAARLNHPCIVRVLEASESTTAIWQVCDLVEGAPLSEHLLKTRLDVSTAVRIIRDLADAISHSHACSVLHRDIKPDNILLDCKPNEPVEHATVRITDFGLARIIDNDSSLMSQMGLLVGTPRYMSPEQLTGNVEEHGVGTDVYALGIVLFEILTGKCPFEESTTISQRIANLEKPTRSMRELMPSLPKDLESIATKCLENRIEERYSTAAALRDDLNRFLRGEPTLARPHPIHEQLIRWTIRNRALASSLAILAVSSMMILGLTIRNNMIYRSQNTKLKESIERIEELAWTKGIRETYLAWNQSNFAEVRQLMASMSSAHPDAGSRIEWRILNAEMRKHMRLMLDLPSAIHEVRWIPNSRWIAAVAADGIIYLVDFETGAIVRKIETGVSSLHALAVSQDGKVLAVGGRTDPKTDLAVPKIYRVEDGLLLQELEGQPTTIESLAFSGDGKQLACGARYEPLQVFDLENGTVSQIPSAARRHDWIAVSMDGESFAAQVTEFMIRDSKFRSPQEESVIKLLRASHCSHWIPGTEFLINASVNDGSLYVSTSGQGDIVANLTGGSENDPFVQIVVQQSGPEEFLVACGSKGGSVALWQMDVRDLVVSDTGNVPSIRSFASWQVSQEPVTSLAIVHQSIFASTVAGELFRMNDISDSKPYTEWKNDRNFIARSGDWSPDGSYAVVGSYEGIYRIGASAMKPESMLPQSTFKALRVNTQDLLLDQPMPRFGLQRPSDEEIKTGFVPAIAFARDGKSLALMLTEGIAISTQEGERYLTQHVPLLDTRGKANLSFSPDGNRLVWDSDERVLSIAHLNSFNAKVDRFEQPGPGEIWAWSPSGKRLVVGGSYSQIIEIELDTMMGKAVADHGVFSTCLAYNGEDQILTGQPNGVIRCWDRVSNTSKVIKAHTGEVVQIALLDQGRIGISADISGNVGVWLAREAETLGLITHDSLAAPSISMTPKPWTDFESTVKLLFINRRGGVSIEQWDIHE
jgi:serine/threonine protein kinase